MAGVPSKNQLDRRRRPPWVGALALFVAALLTVSASVAGGKARYFCERMSRIADDCCCPRAASASLPRPARLTTEIEAADCCRRLTSTTGATVAAAPPTFHDPLVAWLEPLPTLVSVAACASHDAPEPWGIGEKPPRGPPLFIAHCALLL